MNSLKFVYLTLKKNVIEDVSALGGLPFYGIVVAYLLIANFNAALPLIYAHIALFAVVYAIKLVYFKKRPDVSKYKFSSLLERLENSSFPSVHAGRAAVLYMAFFFPQPLHISLFGASLLLAVGMSRLLLKRHYFIDVAAGYIMGIAAGYAFFTV